MTFIQSITPVGIKPQSSVKTKSNLVFHECLLHVVLTKTFNVLINVLTLQKVTYLLLHFFVVILSATNKLWRGKINSLRYVYSLTTVAESTEERICSSNFSLQCALSDCCQKIWNASWKVTALKTWVSITVSPSATTARKSLFRSTV